MTACRFLPSRTHWHMGYSRDDADYKRPHQNENALAESSEKFGFGLRGSFSV